MPMAGSGAKPATILGATEDFGFNVEENPVHVHGRHATAPHWILKTAVHPRQPRPAPMVTPPQSLIVTNIFAYRPTTATGPHVYATD